MSYIMGNHVLRYDVSEINFFHFVKKDEDYDISLQRAFDYFAMKGGGRLFFPVGTYMLSPFRVPSGVILCGVSGKSILKLKNNINQNFVSIDQCFHGGLENITIDGNKANNINSHGVYAIEEVINPAKLSLNTVLKNIKIQWCSGDGLHYSSFGHWVNNFTDLEVWLCDGYGIYYDGTDNQVTNVNISNCKKGAIKCVGSNNRFIGGKLYHSAGARTDGCFQLENCYRNVITGYEIQNSGYTGVTIKNCGQTRIESTVVDFPGCAGVNDAVGYIDVPCVEIIGSREITLDVTMTNVLYPTTPIKSYALTIDSGSRNVEYKDCNFALSGFTNRILDNQYQKDDIHENQPLITLMSNSQSTYSAWTPIVSPSIKQDRKKMYSSTNNSIVIKESGYYLVSILAKYKSQAVNTIGSFGLNKKGNGQSTFSFAKTLSEVSQPITSTYTQLTSASCVLYCYANEEYQFVAKSNTSGIIIDVNDFEGAFVKLY